jgi:hypothetical protein
MEPMNGRTFKANNENENVITSIRPQFVTVDLRRRACQLAKYGQPLHEAEGSVLAT